MEIKKGKIVYKILYGSDAYGTTTNDSDNDIRGIYIPDKNQLLLGKFKDEYRQLNDQEDFVCFSIHKFFQLAVKSNPSVFEWLFVNNKCIQEMLPEGKMIRDARALFLCKELHARFRGFGYSEFSSMTKLTGHTGDKRKQKILKFGYDPKNAMNVIRLLRQGIELLNTGLLIMPRPDRKELIEIKLGKWSYRRIANTVTELFDEIDEAKDKSSLPEKPRYEDVDDLLLKILKFHHGL